MFKYVIIGIIIKFILNNKYSSHIIIFVGFKLSHKNIFKRYNRQNIKTASK